MKKLSLVILTLSILLVAASAQADTFTLNCKTNPGIVSTLKKAIAAKVEETIDSAAFIKTTTNVTMKLLSIESSVDSFTTDDLLAGLTVHDSGDPTGLAFGIDGDSDLSSTGSCIYTYRVIIVSRGIDTGTGEKLGIRTESNITVTTPPYGALKHS